jgi:hypothetical protein
MNENKYNGFAIALAWPETFCKQAGAWYDFFMEKAGISTNNHYKVGHAAVVLVNGENGNCHYFDFGRYHAPFGFGRVRDEISDPDLQIRTRTRIKNFETIENLHEILDELYRNPSCHGTGTIYASYCKVQFDKAYRFATNMKARNPWKYGPFTWNGTNCSRFVRSVILSGDPPKHQSLRLSLPLTFSPTPVGNVKSLGQITRYKAQYDHDILRSIRSAAPPSPVPIRSTLSAPAIPDDLPAKAQWLAGEGAGSWFHIEKNNDQYKICRYDPEGKIECSGLFSSLSDHNFNLKESYTFIHLSHCEEVMIKQNGKIFPFRKFDPKNIYQIHATHSHMSV